MPRRGGLGADPGSGAGRQLHAALLGTWTGRQLLGTVSTAATQQLTSTLCCWEKHIGNQGEGHGRAVSCRTRHKGGLPCRCPALPLRATSCSLRAENCSVLMALNLRIVVYWPRSSVTANLEKKRSLPACTSAFALRRLPPRQACHLPSGICGQDLKPPNFTSKASKG